MRQTSGKARRTVRPRCHWAKSALAVRYHDREWGVPVRDDRKLFEMLILEGAQAGLSWETILAKRERYREVFARFDPALVARFTSDRVERLLADPGIVRNRLKIAGTITNAKRFLDVQREFGSFVKYLRTLNGATADQLSKDLKQRGFTFVGPTIMYAFMQAVGIVNDHERNCWRYKKKRGDL
ncbi:MAG TPA: DNA-3-methyladenine glycosylase I [Candidatus Eremiobacteraceae bacterium]|nr:DNA-3-methyladenine glycosylase I [Candidatus Eremiobacteraceae bacterium]